MLTFDQEKRPNIQEVIKRTIIHLELYKIRLDMIFWSAYESTKKFAEKVLEHIDYIMMETKYGISSKISGLRNFRLFNEFN